MAYPASIGGSVTGSGNTVPVPDGVVFAYNGVTFGPYVRTKVTEEPVMSGDGRMVKMSKITISASGWITAEDAGGEWQASHASLVNSGSLYQVGDLLTVGGSTQPVQIEVDTVAGGGSITSYHLHDNGSYDTLPPNPVTPAGGNGNGAVFDIIWNQTVYNTLDEQMLAIRRKLQVNGKYLQYVNEGYGSDLDINNPDAVGGTNPDTGTPSIRDVAFGPKPGPFTWFSLGGAPDGCHGAGFEWSITTFIAECGRFNIAPGVFIEVSFTVSYATDERGVVTISYQGSATIPMSLRANNTIDRNVDSEIQRIIRAVPVGFERTMQRQLSADRASCSFSITDKQLLVPYPNDIVKMSMDHKVKQNKATFLCPTWDCTLSGTVEISPTADRFIAWRRFFAIASQRIAFTRFHPAVQSIRRWTTLNGLVTRTWQPSVFVMATEFTEKIFENSSTFTINYRIMGAPYDVVVRVSGLWQPVVNNAINNIDQPFTAATWTASLANNAQQFRGYLGANFPNPAAEVIIDVCAGPLGGVGASQNQPVGQVAGDFGRRDRVVSSTPDEGALQELEPSNLVPSRDSSIDSRFPPESSWIAWRCDVQRIVDHKRIRHKGLGGAVTTPKPQIDPFGGVDAVAKDDSAPSVGWSSTINDVVQQIAAPSMTLRLVGYAVRLGHRANPPKMISYGGQTAYLQNEVVTERQLVASPDFVSYRVDWDLLYIIPGAPSSLPLPANPMLGTDGTASGGGLQSGVVG